MEHIWNTQILDTYLLSYKKSQQNHLFPKMQSIEKTLSQILSLLYFQNVKLVERKTFCGYWISWTKKSMLFCGYKLLWSLVEFAKLEKFHVHENKYLWDMLGKISLSAFHSHCKTVVIKDKIVIRTWAIVEYLKISPWNFATLFYKQSKSQSHPKIDLKIDKNFPQKIIY